MIPLLETFETQTRSRVISCRVPEDVYEDIRRRHGTTGAAILKWCKQDIVKRYGRRARIRRGITRLGRYLRSKLKRSLRAVVDAEADGRIGGPREVSAIAQPLTQCIQKILQPEVLRR